MLLVQELINLFQYRQAKIISLTTKTVPQMRKTNNPFLGRVHKLTNVNGVTYWDYQKAVNKQRGRENKPGDFLAEERSWGQRVPNSPLVEHNGRYYIELKVQKAESDYYIDNRLATPEEKETLLTFIPRKSSPKQGLEREVILRDYALDNILQIRMDGEIIDV